MQVHTNSFTITFQCTQHLVGHANIHTKVKTILAQILLRVCGRVCGSSRRLSTYKWKYASRLSTHIFPTQMLGSRCLNDSAQCVGCFLLGTHLPVNYTNTSKVRVAYLIGRLRYVTTPTGTQCSDR
jgi:hypothetical protein